ncbi:MAG: DUF1559 domain-containing protein [Pirellulales bacterium]|nr:DUF1559 domain-containing protein [Pirellulales bacterium]
MLHSNVRLRRSRIGFTLIELLILVAILGILIALLLPAIARARQAARAAQSKNNLAILGVAMKHYEALGKGNVPPETWEKTLTPYVDEIDKVMTCPLRDQAKRNDGVYSYAMYTGAAEFGAADAGKIAIVTSDHRLIDIETEKCEDGKPVVTGEPVARDRDLAFALLYGGAVRAFELSEIIPDNNETIVIWWLPNREDRKVCGKVIAIDGAAAD